MAKHCICLKIKSKGYLFQRLLKNIFDPKISEHRQTWSYHFTDVCSQLASQPGHLYRFFFFSVSQKSFCVLELKQNWFTPIAGCWGLLDYFSIKQQISEAETQKLCLSIGNDWLINKGSSSHKKSLSQATIGGGQFSLNPNTQIWLLENSQKTPYSFPRDVKLVVLGLGLLGIYF